MSRHVLACLAILLSVTVHKGSLAQPAPATVSIPYTWRNVAIGGGGFVTGIVIHPDAKGLMYARTDVGGAYRWNDAARRWMPLNDWTSETDWNLMGIESLAIDPRDPQRLYLAAGTYSRFPATILRSEDQGHTFRRTDVAIAMGGNEAGRFAGERLVVDPNDGRVLLFGTRKDGLWRSTDGAVTWQPVNTFPKYDEPPPPPPSGSTGTRQGPPAWHFNQPVGIVAVAFDVSSGQTNQPTPVIYAAVSTTKTNLYRSADAGATWSPVANQPTGLRPNHLVLAADQTLYLSYSREPGPGQMSAGAIWKLDLGHGMWTEISPLKGSDTDLPFGYGCVAVDPRVPTTLVVTTFTHWRPHDQIFRSTDGGATWKALWNDDTTWDHSTAPYTATRRPHWFGTIALDPYNPDRALFTTGYGIWASTNLTQVDAGKPVNWEFLDNGLEETVPLALVSPPEGPHLISGLGDIDGFYHGTLDQSPLAGSFSGPRFASTRDIAFAAAHPNVMARIGNAGRGVSVHAAVSDDGGLTWQSLFTDPPQGGNGMGRVALNADGTMLVWALSNGTAFATSDRGKTWTPCIEASAPLTLAADPVDATRFYAFDAQVGKLLVSTDAGRRFVASAASLPATPPNAREADLAAMPNRKGDLWIALPSAGLFHSTDGGAKFVKISPVEAALAVGFGQPAPGHDVAAIYLRGKIGGTHAFFRSDDRGTTWARINDDQHQFGAANRPIIIGDPRVYGRVYLSTGGRGIVMGEPR